MAQINSVNELLSGLRRRAPVILGVMVIGFIASVLFALSLSKRYEATAVVQIEAPQIAVSSVPAASDPSGDASDNRLRLIEQKVMSRDQLLEIIEKFNLFSEFPAMSRSDRVTALREGVQIDEIIDPVRQWQVGVEPSGLRIRVVLGKARQAADVANDLMARVLAEGEMRRSGKATRTLAFYRAEESRIREALSALEGQIADFKTENSGSLAEGLAAQRSEIATLREARFSLEQQRLGLEANSDRLRSEDLARQQELLREQSRLIEERIATRQGNIDAAPMVERRLAMLERQRSQLQEEFRVVTARRADAAMTQEIESRGQFERFEVLETALVPEQPISASRSKIAMAGGVMTLLLAFGFALFLEWASPVLRTSAQIERALGLRPVIAIPDLRSGRRRFPRGFAFRLSDSHIS